MGGNKMKILKFTILTIISIGLLSFGLPNDHNQELGIDQKSNKILIQYGHGKGI